jgi:hypothetical protein
VRPVLIEAAKRPALPVGQNPEARLETLAGTPSARPVPRGLALDVVVVRAGDNVLVPVSLGEGRRVDGADNEVDVVGLALDKEELTRA